MKTKEEMLAILKNIGIKKRFKPYCQGERDTILLEVHKPAIITNGIMSGVEIDLYDTGTFRVWTSRKRKAMIASKLHGLKIRCLDGEAELFVPVNLADELLPKFGAKIKHNLSPERLIQAREFAKRARESAKRLANYPRNRPDLQKNTVPNEVQDAKDQNKGLGTPNV